MLEQRSDVRVRRAKFSDAADLVATFRESWRLAYRGIIPHAHLEAMIARRTAVWWRSAIRSRDSVYVIEVADKVVGYATCGRARSGIGRAEGEIYELYLAPEYQGLGFGEYLFEACRSALDQRRMRGLMVWALAENTSAIAFYWRRGGRPVAETTECIGGARMAKYAFHWD